MWKLLLLVKIKGTVEKKGDLNTGGKQSCPNCHV